MTDNTAELKRSIREVLHSQGVAVLSTRGEEYPHSCLVAFAFTEDLVRIFFATSRTSRKYSNIQQDARGSILVDTRSNDEDDFVKASAVSAQGRIEDLSYKETGPLADLLLKRHPYLTDFLKAPTTAFMAMTVSSYALVSRFQNVLLLDMEREISRY